MSTIVKKELQRRIPWPATSFFKSLLWTPSYISARLNKCSTSNRAKGAFVLTFDVETANDLVHDMNLKSAVNIGLKTRKALLSVKAMAEKYEIPITLFCTGHAILESCDKHRYGVFDWADMKHGFASFWPKKDWFCYDPGTNCEKDPAWYFGDVIKLFIDSVVPHEIGSHTFGHIRCDLVQKDTFLDDMAMLKEASKGLGITLRSHAYPWDRPRYMDQLSSLSIKICRWKGGKIIATIEKRSGVSIVYESLCGRPYLALIKRGIDVAIRNRAVFLWMLHPIETYTVFGRKFLAKVLSYVKEKRANNLLETKTMYKLIPSENTSSVETLQN